MSEFGRGAIWFGAGLVLGYLGSKLMEDPQGKVRRAAVEAVSQGMTFKDRVMTSVERARENVEDMVAEARHSREGIKEAGSADPASEK
ncbi:hypothetical protein [Desulfonatronovibrio hydrogenovorans]|uniref:hypothetical protein n=1 Tax=Desulfonatronovibrio hydrogenovorans TaxID=53245 RepID=UPI000556C2E9|nr:hypothetical protein [Desulfonatronovibrio hydrogenovorans]